MTTLVERVRAALGECVTTDRLKKKGCSVSLKKAPRPHVIADFDKSGSPFGKNKTRCDYLFVADGACGIGWVAPLELKRGRLKAGEAVRQLQAAERFVARTEPVRFRPVAAFRNIHKAERRELRRHRVLFHGCSDPVRLIRCGELLTSALQR